MCRPASFVVTKDRVFWSPNGDCHELIISENELKESNIRSEIQFVRVEICPPDEDFRTPLDQWKYRTDQDLLPGWYVESEEEKRVRDILPEWLESKVILPDQTREIRDKYIVACYGTVEARGNSTVKACGNSTVEAFDNSTVEARGNSTVKAFDDSTVKAFGNGTVEVAKGRATIIAYNSLTPDILKSSKAVMIDRSKNTVVCYVGKDI